MPVPGVARAHLRGPVACQSLTSPRYDASGLSGELALRIQSYDDDPLPTSLPEGIGKPPTRKNVTRRASLLPSVAASVIVRSMYE